MPARTRLTAALGALAVVALVGAGCGRSGPDGSAALRLPADTAGLADLAGTLQGGGSSFQDTFEQQVAADFAAAVDHLGGSVTLTYTKSGSSDGKKSLADETIDFAGSDSPIKVEERSLFGSRRLLYFPIMGGPIALAYNVRGVDELKLRPEVVAGIFQARITRWDDPAIAADNPDVDLPGTRITVVHRSDGSGTTSNFTSFLAAAAPEAWKLGAGETVNWPSATQGAEKSTGVTTTIKDTDGAIGYADLPDAAKELLDVAEVANPAGQFAAPTPDNASAALAAAEVEVDLTYDPLNVDADGAYPITSPTWIIVDATQGSEAKAEAIRAYLRYLLTVGQGQAKALLYAPLPKRLAAQALAQVSEITAG